MTNHEAKVRDAACALADEIEKAVKAGYRVSLAPSQLRAIAISTTAKAPQPEIPTLKKPGKSKEG